MGYGDWIPTIGLEIHAQLKTKSKIFSSESADFGGGDNEYTSSVSLGLPGALPTLNREVLHKAVVAGLSLNCKINPFSRFDRKSYFYPDMPRGYQITQFKEPICGEGFVEIFLDGSFRKVGIERAHLEEDAGKSTHHGQYTLVNFNRSGVPLLEIVSKPEIGSAAEAAEYARTVRKLLRYGGVCDGNLEEGSLRVDCNVSIRKTESEPLGTKVEIKNLNSFRFIEKAVEYEIQRQIECKESSVEIVQETRLFDSVKGQTFSMRTKEEADDYRYFPEPDLLPCVLEEGIVEKYRTEVPEGPVVRAKRYVEDYELSYEDAFILTEERGLSDYYEEVAKKSNEPKAAGHWVTGEVLRVLNDQGMNYDQFFKRLPAGNLARIVELVKGGDLSGKMGKKVFDVSWEQEKSPDAVVEELGLKQVSDEGAIEKIVDEILANNLSQVEEFKAGKQKVMGFFVGQVMKATKGQGNPAVVNKILKKKLES